MKNSELPGISRALEGSNRPSAIVTVLPQPQRFIAESPDDTEARRIESAWCIACDILVRFMQPFLPSQKEAAWRACILSREDHNGHLLETIPDWPNISSPGMIGRRARLTYSAIRKMTPETFLRIIAKFPRRKSAGEATVAEVVRKIAADPVLREALVPRRLKT